MDHTIARMIALRLLQRLIPSWPKSHKCTNHVHNFNFILENKELFKTFNNPVCFLLFLAQSFPPSVAELSRFLFYCFFSTILPISYNYSGYILGPYLCNNFVNIVFLLNFLSFYVRTCPKYAIVYYFYQKIFFFYFKV